MTRAGTEKQFTALPFLLTPFFCLSADQFRLGQSLILPKKASSPVDVVDIAIYQDVNNDPIIIYLHFSGEEGFINLDNIDNISESNSLMFREDENSKLSAHSAIDMPFPTNPDSLYYQSNSSNSSASRYVETFVFLHNSIFDNVTSTEQDGFISKISRESGNRLQIKRLHNAPYGSQIMTLSQDEDRHLMQTSPDTDEENTSPKTNDSHLNGAPKLDHRKVKN